MTEELGLDAPAAPDGPRPRARAVATVVEPALGLHLVVGVSVGRTPRPERCDRCRLRRVLVAVEVTLDPLTQGLRVPTAIVGAQLAVQSPKVCLDCAGLRWRDDGRQQAILDALDAGRTDPAPSTDGPVQGPSSEDHADDDPAPDPDGA